MEPTDTRPFTTIGALLSVPSPAKLQDEAQSPTVRHMLAAVGRSGIRRRKRKRQYSAAEDTGILADLEDQAAWSSYGQAIPRLGNPRRNAIWWNRWWRLYRNLGRTRRNPEIQDSGFWTAILVGVIGVALFLALAALILLAVDRLL